MEAINDVVAKLCAAGADSLRRYALISGEDPCSAPEYFMPSFVSIALGDQRITTTLETSFSKLKQWNDDSRQRSGSPPGSTETLTKLLALVEETKDPRVDLVLFESSNSDTPKNNLNLLALVEFKRGDIERGGDRNKLLRVLTHIDTCDFGIACGWVEARDDYLTWQRCKAETCGDIWYQEPVTAVDPNHKCYFFCARLFRRGAPLLPLTEVT